MAFKSDNQRKAVMAKLNSGNTRSQVKPSLIGTVKGKLRRKFRPTEAELQEERRARIAREQKQLEEEGQRAKLLEAEAKVETARQAVRAKETEARARLAEIDAERFARTRRGKVLALGKRGLKAGVTAGRKALAESQRPAPRRKGKKKKEVEQTGFFGI